MESGFLWRKADLAKGEALPASERGRAQGPRVALLMLVLVLAIALFGRIVGQHYAIGRWLVWRYLGCGAGAILWGVACLALGHWLLRRAIALPLRFADELALAFPLGAFAFGLLQFGLGLVGLLSKVSFFLLPAAALALGGRGLATTCRRLRRHLAAKQNGRWRVPVAWLALAAAATLGLALVYFPVLEPSAYGYDARWYHLPLAEHYAAGGAIRRFGEGWWLGAYPQLASYLYSWAFLAPTRYVFDRALLAGTLEFCCFLGTLAAIPSLVRELAPRLRSPFSWLFVFAFPGIYLYDSNLNAGADHVAALFAAPLAVTLRRFLRDFEPRWGLLFGAYAAGALLTKYTAAILLFLPALAIAARTVWLARTRPRHALSGAALVFAVVAVLTAPHWLKNWVWYGSPLYPSLRASFGAAPFSREAEGVYAEFVGMMAQPPPGWAGLREAFVTTFTFSFTPHDWFVLHRDWPVFGSLFTLSLPLALLQSRLRRVLVGHAAVMLAVFGWFLLHHYDRYLQVLVPWMAAATAATLVSTWRLRILPLRLGIVGLVGLQLLWGADTPFLATHNLLQESPLQRLLARASSGFAGEQHRLDVFAPWSSMGQVLPKGSTVLVHESPIHLGLCARSVSDLGAGYLSFSTFSHAEDARKALRALRVTHLAWQTGTSGAHLSLASDLIFFELAQASKNPQTFGSMTLAELPVNPLPRHAAREVLVYGCSATLNPGWYNLSDFQRYPGYPRKPKRPIEQSSLTEELRSSAGFIVYQPGCGGLPDAAIESFAQVATRESLQIWLRKANARGN
jgi:hypothetical protein